MPQSFTQSDLYRIADDANALTRHLTDLSAAIRLLLPATAAPGDLREKSIYNLGISAHDLEIGFLLSANCLVVPNWWRQFPRYATGTDTQIAQNASHFHDLLLRGVFFSEMMTVEYYFRGLHRCLINSGSDNAGVKWWQVKATTLTHLGLGARDENQLLVIMTNIRNCIHNNGVFTQNDVTISWRNQSYSFVRNYPPNCLTPAFLFLSLTVVGDFMAEISRMAPVLALPSVENFYDRIGQRPTN